MQHALFNKWSIIKVHSIFKIYNGIRKVHRLLNRYWILYYRDILMKWRSRTSRGDMLCRGMRRHSVRWLVSRIYRKNQDRRLWAMVCSPSACKTTSSWHKVGKASKSPVTNLLAAQSKLMFWFQPLNRNRQSIEKSKKVLMLPRSNLPALQNHQARPTQMASPSTTSFPVKLSNLLKHKCKQLARYLNIISQIPKMETN